MAATRMVDLTWYELTDLVPTDPVVLVPVGTVEQHGPHLPLDTDNAIAESFAGAAAEAAPPGAALVAPCVPFGLSEHLSDFPGAIFHTTKTLIVTLTEVCTSLARSGLRRILMINGHGSNVAPIDLASREALMREPEALFASVSWWELGRVRDVATRLGPPSPASHACAFETSLMLAISPERVHMDRAVPGEEFPTSPHVWRDTLGRAPSPEHRRPIHLTEFWSSWSDNGVRGDPRGATAELGAAMLAAGADELAEIIDELRKRPILGRRAITGHP
ncbi:MAG: creatininase family protein [Acidimicrobiia bacterium]|nr:creatininase family protein [Acidimicrobiia bacterium]